VQAAVAALVALVLVDAARSLEAARVHVLLAHRTTKETLAAVARLGAVVLPRRTVAADRALRPTTGAAAAAAPAAEGPLAARDRRHPAAVETDSARSTCK